jgi:hypothetical protein
VPLCIFLGEWAFSKAGFTIFAMTGEDKLHSLEIKASFIHSFALSLPKILIIKVII